MNTQPSDADARTRTALVTGGAERVGAAIVQSLAAQGFMVAYTSRSSNVPDARQCVFPLRIDVSELPQAADALGDAVNHHFDGRLDVLIHNASAYEAGTLDQVTLDQIRLMNRVHVEAPILITQRLAPMLRAAGGHVITMLDITVERPMPSYLAYCASKAALANLTRALARELAPEVTVNGIAPGVVAWPDEMPGVEREAYLARVPLRRAGTPAEVAELVRFLATEGRYITGQVIRLDGGRSLV